MPQVTGVRDTENIQQAKRVIDMAETIALLEPNESPFMSFMKIAKRNVRTVFNPKYEWSEDNLGARWDAINNASGYLAAATSLVVDNGTYFAPGYVVKVPRTGEVFIVTAVSTNTLTVVRGYGVTTAADLVDNDPLLIIGNANNEGAKAPEIRSTLEVPVYNYTQIFRTVVGATRTNEKSKHYGGNDLAYQRRKKGVEHKIDMSRSFILGERKLDTTGAKPRRTTGGLLSYLTKNNYDAGGQLTQSEFDNNISEVIFKFGSKEKLMLCSARLISVINGWALGKLMINQEAKKYGLNIMQYVTPHGTLNLLNESKILEGAVYGGYGIIIDPANVGYCPLNGSDTKLRTNIQDNDEDGTRDEYLTEAGLEVKLPDTHGVLTGVTS
ncbi:hypothetical protein D3C72_245160 [compost metagenome]